MDSDPSMHLDQRTQDRLRRLPDLTVDADPTSENWNARLKEELHCLIQYVGDNRSRQAEWFHIRPTDRTGVSWSGKCWYFHDSVKYDFVVEFEIPVGYPRAPIAFRLPELIGKTKKMYQGGAICQTIHFLPLWRKNSPRFGLAHALMLGLAPWLAAEIPVLVARGKVVR